VRRIPILEMGEPHSPAEGLGHLEGKVGVSVTTEIERIKAN
jgi:hypothetical protein